MNLANTTFVEPIIVYHKDERYCTLFSKSFFPLLLY